MRPPATDPPLPLRTPADASAALATFAFCLATSVATAAVEVSSVTIDGRTVAIRASAEAAPAAEPVRIPSTARAVVFAFAGDATAAGLAEDDQTSDAASLPGSRPRSRPTRLRYRLDGVDTAWRDPPASGRLDLRFEDEENGAIDNKIQLMEGESPAWKSPVEEARFTRHMLSAVVPPLTKAVRINFVSHYPGPSVGVIGIDDVELEVQRRKDSTIDLYSLGPDLGGRKFAPMLTPSPWAKSGNRVVMSQLRMRPGPTPRPILVIIDDDPSHYGGWYQSPRIDIEPGDRVTVSWSAAWSLGVGGNATAEYANPKAGTYFFRVGGFYPNGEPSGIEAVLPIEVYVPWHLRHEVWAGVAMLGLAGVVTAGLEIRLDVPDEVPAAPLPGRVRHNLVLIVREAVNNVVKHAAANLVRLGLSIDDRTVTITVEDDGRGFDATASADDGRHSGLANMRRRADDVGGSLTITSRPGAGTRVEITAPLA